MPKPKLKVFNYIQFIVANNFSMLDYERLAELRLSPETRICPR